MPHHCFTCEDTVLRWYEGETWKCPKCGDVYYACATCEDGLDHWDNDKGFTCVDCGRHWCSSFACMDKGNFHFDEDDDDEPHCDECWAQRENA